jgi:hypothetical protein
MCDYSLLNVKSRRAKVRDKLITRDFDTGTRGFAAAEDNAMAICIPPRVELAFSTEVTITRCRLFVVWKSETLRYATAIFRQVNKNEQFKHNDTLEFPDGRIVNHREATSIVPVRLRAQRGREGITNVAKSSSN